MARVAEISRKRFISGFPQFEGSNKCHSQETLVQENEITLIEKELGGTLLASRRFSGSTATL
jgi:hypothetical protein